MGMIKTFLGKALHHTTWERPLVLTVIDFYILASYSERHSMN